MLEELSVDDLRQRLEEKEQTVATLTQYLEQAASKLNALQKQSPVKSSRAFDEQEVHRQMKLVESLQAAVQEWEELKAPATLERVSTQLDQLRDTILDGLKNQAYSATPAMPSYTSVLMENAPNKSAAESINKTPVSMLEGWEALKAEMLKEVEAAEEVEEEQRNIDLKEELEVLVNRPERVDADCQDRNVWQEAVDAREKYMISLIRALRVVESRRRGAPDWESFTGAPPELREQVSQQATELHQTLRNAEVELSIERARISRQESVIAQQRREIDKAQKKQSYPNQSAASGSDASDSQQGRWLRFLGKTNNDGK